MALPASDEQLLQYAHERLEEILSGPGFYGIEQTLYERVSAWWQQLVTSVLEWLGTRLSRGLIFLIDDIGWLTLLLILIGTLLLASYLFRQSRRSFVREGRRWAASQAVDEDAEPDAQAWLLHAQKAGEEGEYKLAVRYLYQAALATLAATGVLTIKPNATNRQYLRQARSLPQERFQPFSQLTRLFERIWYGNEPAGSEEYEQGRALLRSVLE